MARYSMLIDLTRCIGCDACTVACKQENGTPLDTFFARVVNIEAGKFPNVKRIYLPMLCYHCENPACLKACPNKAIVKRRDGIVLIDQDRCRGTGACVSACPYGNVILSERSQWYLDSEQAYERDFVKPRLREGVARKCTYCAHRVDEGLDPACVVACPTNARIFGDLDDSNSVLSNYIVEQREKTGREPFPLLASAGTLPAGAYLDTMAAQESALSNELHNQGTHGTGRPKLTKALFVILIAIAVLLASKLSFAQTTEGLRPSPEQVERFKENLFSTSSCIGCHGQEAMGGMGPPIAGTKLTEAQFLSIVRHGKGMMPGTSASDLSDSKVEEIRQELLKKPWVESQIPIAYKVGQVLKTKNVAMIFLFVFAFAFVFGIKVLFYWLKVSNLAMLLPYIPKFGVLRATWVLFAALVVDGFFVASLWRKSRFRWAMHGLILYGFCGLILGDVLMQIYNPTRGDLPLLDPIKLLLIASGASVMLGVFYVMFRYRVDDYIDNGMTLGRDFLFVNLLFHTIVSGFLTVVLNRLGISGWLMTIYLYHLVSIGLLIGTAPFTRFAHVWVVPALVAVTRLTEEMVKAGVDLGFQREPSPGRHHKTVRIAREIAERLAPEAGENVNIRYYP